MRSILFTFVLTVVSLVAIAAPLENAERDAPGLLGDLDGPQDAVYMLSGYKRDLTNILDDTVEPQDAAYRTSGYKREHTTTNNNNKNGIVKERMRQIKRQVADTTPDTA